MTADDRSPLAQHLDSLTRTALSKLEEMINEPNGPDRDDHGPLARIQADAAKTILIAQMRVDAAKLRDRQEADNVRQILEAVLARKAELAEEEAAEARRRTCSLLDLDDNE